MAPLSFNTRLKEYDIYTELVYKVASWSPLIVPNPRLYSQVQSFIDTAYKLKPYGIILKHYLALKAGKQFRVANQINTGDLEQLIGHKEKYAAIARWILARIYASGICLQKSNDNNYRSLKAAHKLITGIVEPIEFDIPVLLPGIRSETTIDNLRDDFCELSDPKINLMPVPYRYLAAYSLNLATYKMPSNPIRANELLEEAKEYCKTSMKRYSTDHTFMSINIELTNTVIDTVLLRKGNSQINKNNVIDHFNFLTERIDTCVKKHELHEQKGHEWTAGAYAGLAALTKHSDHYTFIDKLHQQIETVIQERKGQADFFVIDVIYELAHRSKEERRKFRTLITQLSSNKFHQNHFTESSTSQTKVTVIKKYKFMGDIISNNSAPVNNRSIVNSFNKIEEKFGKEAVLLLERIAKEVEKSGDKHAQQLMEEFHEEIQKPKPKKSKLKSSWKRFAKIVPSLTNADKILGIIEKISKIVASYGGNT
jgi:hypothetical protein